VFMTVAGNPRHCAGLGVGSAMLKIIRSPLYPGLVSLLLLSGCYSQQQARHTMPAPLLRGTVPSPGEDTQLVAAAERIAWTWNATTEALTTLPQPASVGRVRVSGGVLTNVMDETIYVGAEGNRVYALVPRTGEVSEALYHPTTDTRKHQMHSNHIPCRTA
jgi:hypothetical protein